ncbi:glycosyltransferase family 2 protein [Phytopseudomonas dryadis]|uniref:Glycosyl transferase family 2 n=1 Tax=Phytopseudomonas dryadis TaxID=2487520 RepID=A0A4Q9QVJ5_9GAMM|nr:glycosyl transferase family 2 [Pseudomonas dryadis]TBU86721.1 glycosyl transferase family 2 [Pseudomonas dryadis]
MTEHSPTIVVIGYNRPKSLSRLLGSLRKARYPSGHVRLVISLDNSGNPEPRQVAEAFDWPFGEKRIIAHQERLGLRKHVLSCGDLTEQYDDVIILEDDLFVSPFFYEYASRALEAYADDAGVAGISLYSVQFNQTANLPFTPVDDGDSDVHFMQLAASWGQAWSRRHWQGFRSWLDSNGSDIGHIDNIPADIRSWPESSWLKLYNAYIISRDLYFVYPFRSLSTNFGDPGQHFNIASSRFQVPIQQQPIDYQFAKRENSLSVYDAFCELLPACLKRQNEKLAGYDFTVNLYGCKDCRSGLQLTRTQAAGLHNFSLSMKPMELSILHDIEGDGIALIDSAGIDSASLSRPKTEYDIYRFFYKFPSVRIILFGVVERLQLLLKRVMPN